MTKIMKGGVAYNSTANMVALTQAEYNALSTAQKNNGNFYCITDADPSYFSAENIDYDNTESGLLSTNIQDAIDELIESKTAYSTTEKVVGKWIDGSTVYEKTVEVSGLSSNVSNWTNIVAIPNVDKIIDFSGCGFPASNNQQTSLGDYIRLCYIEGYLKYYSTAWSNTTLTIRATVRYTKSST